MEMCPKKIFVIMAVVFILLLIWISFSSQEHICPCERMSNFYQANLYKNMDYIKDRKGFTLDDRILEDALVKGAPIQSPF